MSIFTLVLVAISLSMDAFSLSLLYGTLNFSMKLIITSSLCVGIFHFFMPLFGYIFASYLSKFLVVNTDIFIGIIFIILSISMFFSYFKDEEIHALKSILSILLFSFTVSLDSFSLGIGLGFAKGINVISFLIFSLFSFIFTFSGFKLGSILSLKFGKLSTIVGSIILLFIGIFQII